MLEFTLTGLGYPFIGTLIGSAFVFFMKNSPGKKMMAVLDSLAAGIMCAASFFSLISPALNASSEKGRFSLFLCSVGFFTGMTVFIISDKILKRFFSSAETYSGKMLMWAVSLHNIPEGMAVGVVYAGILTDSGEVSIAGALSLSVGIALQNIPEGAIISMPLKARGESKIKAFFCGTVSGFAELAAAVLTLFLSSFVNSILPFSLCFAAGAMFFVVMSELSSDFSKGNNSRLALFVFSLGFTVMMMLDTFLS